MSSAYAWRRRCLDLPVCVIVGSVSRSDSPNSTFISGIQNVGSRRDAAGQHLGRGFLATRGLPPPKQAQNRETTSGIRSSQQT